jgi:predicted alpha/beta superfamily hydrolase
MTAAVRWRTALRGVPLLAMAMSAFAGLVPAPAVSGTTGPFAAAAQAAPGAAPGRVLAHESFAIESRLLGEARRINVYTPPGYGEGRDRRFPVLYMPDGGVGEDFPHVIADVDALIRAGEMRPVIVAGIENTERRRDMTGPTTVDDDRKIAPRVGGSAAFRAFIRDELMPAIAARYRVSGEKGIVGESLAGLFVLETLFLEPGLFDTYIAISPSLWWNGQALVRGASAWLAAHPRVTATLYLTTAGDDDIDAAAKRLATALQTGAPKGLRLVYAPRPDLQHATIYRGVSREAFRAVFPPIAGGKEAGW